MKWAVVVQNFLISVDRENGSFLHLPVAGGTLDQPYKTMTVYSYLQSLFMQEIEKANKRGARRGKR